MGQAPWRQGDKAVQDNAQPQTLHASTGSKAGVASPGGRGRTFAQGARSAPFCPEPLLLPAPSCCSSPAASCSFIKLRSSSSRRASHACAGWSATMQRRARSSSSASKQGLPAAAPAGALSVGVCAAAGPSCSTSWYASGLSARTCALRCHWLAMGPTLSLMRICTGQQHGRHGVTALINSILVAQQARGADRSLSAFLLLMRKEPCPHSIRPGTEHSLTPPSLQLQAHLRSLVAGLQRHSVLVACSPQRPERSS